MALNEGLKTLLINKLKSMGVDPADAARLASQSWFQDYAMNVYKGTLPKGVPEITEKEITKFYSDAKKTGADPVQLFATEVAPSSLGAQKGSAAAAKAAFEYGYGPQETAPTPPAPIPTAGGAPQQGSLAPTVTPTSTSVMNTTPSAAPTLGARTPGSLVVPQAAPTGPSLVDMTGFQKAPAFGSTNEKQAAIIREAARIGVTPLELATVMEYETIGKMSPDTVGGEKDGVKGGYRGLIQFGPQEQKDYKIKPNMSFDQQAAAAGQFLIDRGFPKWKENNPNATQQEMRTALYSTVNAGSPGRENWNKPDVNNTVAGHAKEMFAPNSPWLKKAEAFMGESGPSPFEQVAQRTTDTGSPVLASSVGDAPTPVNYGPVLSPEQDMGQLQEDGSGGYAIGGPLTTLGAFPMPGDAGQPPTPLPETVQAPPWQTTPDPEQSKYVTGPQSFTTEVPKYREGIQNPSSAPALGAPQAGPLGTTTAPPPINQNVYSPNMSQMPPPEAPMSPMPQMSPFDLATAPPLGAPTGPSQDMRSMFPLAGGPPGTVPSQSPTEPNTYRPSNTMFPQTQSPINQPQMSPFDPTKAPPLGGAPTQTSTDPYSFTPPQMATGGWPSEVSGQSPIGQAPMEGIGQWPALSAAVAPPNPTPNPMGPERQYGGMPMPKPGISEGFSPTRGAPTLGLGPQMAELQSQSGFGGDMQQGFMGSSAPPVGFAGMGINPATFVGLPFTPKGGDFAGTEQGIPNIPMPIRKPTLPPLISPPPVLGGAPSMDKVSSGVGAAAAQAAQAKALQGAIQSRIQGQVGSSIANSIASQMDAWASRGLTPVGGAAGAFGALAGIGGGFAPEKLNYGMNIGFGGGF